MNASKRLAVLTSAALILIPGSALAQQDGPARPLRPRSRLGPPKARVTPQKRPTLPPPDLSTASKSTTARSVGNTELAPQEEKSRQPDRSTESNMGNRP